VKALHVTRSDFDKGKINEKLKTAFIIIIIVLRHEIVSHSGSHLPYRAEAELDACQKSYNAGFNAF
jgi:hypothetical protein